MNGITRDNHFVQQLYLEAWKNTNGKVWTYDLLVPDTKYYLWNEKSIKSIAYQHDFYTRLDKKEEVDDIEKYFNSKFETPASKPLKKAVKGENLSDEDWKKLINYIGCQLVRTPAFAHKLFFDYQELIKKSFEEGVLDIEKKLNTISKEECKSLTHNKETDNLYELFPLKVVNTGIKNDDNKTLISIETVFGKSLYLHLMMYLLKNITKILNNHEWNIINLDDRVKIPTSDDPVICMNYYSNNNYDFNGGWNKTGSEFIFPISPNKIIYSKVGVKDINFNPNYELSVIIKNIIIQHAYRRIFSIDNEKEITKVRKRIVNKKLFEKEKMNRNNWHEYYKKYEAEYLEHKLIKKDNSKV